MMLGDDPRTKVSLCSSERVSWVGKNGSFIKDSLLGNKNNKDSLLGDKNSFCDSGPGQRTGRCTLCVFFLFDSP